MLPNWIIIGFPKTSSSSVYQWLVDHPDVSGPRIKETCYFADPGTRMFAKRPEPVRTRAGYERCFDECDPSARVIMEATPQYVYSDSALRELPDLPTRPRFIVLLREPVAQLRSLHGYFQHNWDRVPPDMDFGAFIRAVREGHARLKGNELVANALDNAWYSKHLQRWLDVVGRDRLTLLLFEDIVRDPGSSMRALAATMGIDPDFYDNYDFPVENATYAARSRLLQRINIKVRSRLPQNGVYRAIRGIYRAINTRTPVQQRDFATEQALTDHFEPMLDELQQKFGIDVSVWKTRSVEARAGAEGDAVLSRRPTIDSRQ